MSGMDTARILDRQRSGVFISEVGGGALEKLLSCEMLS